MHIIYTHHKPISDQPTDVSTMAHYKDGGYEDVLEERRHTSDLKYAMKSRPDVPRYKYCKPRTPAEIKTQVLNSDRLRYTIEKVCAMFPDDKMDHAVIQLATDLMLFVCCAHILFGCISHNVCEFHKKSNYTTIL